MEPITVVKQVVKSGSALTVSLTSEIKRLGLSVGDSVKVTIEPAVDEPVITLREHDRQLRDAVDNFIDETVATVIKRFEEGKTDEEILGAVFCEFDRQHPNRNITDLASLDKCLETISNRDLLWVDLDEAIDKVYGLDCLTAPDTYIDDLCEAIGASRMSTRFWQIMEAE